MKMKTKYKGWNIFINVFLASLSVICIGLLLMIVSISFSKESDVVNSGFSVFPKHFDLSAYKLIFSNTSIILRRTAWTLFVALVAPIPTIVVGVMFAYPLTKSDFVLKKLYTRILLISNFCGAGMVATYVIYTKVYKLGNNPLIYFLPGINMWGIMVYKTIFNGVPKSLIEAAKIDGATEPQILYKIVIPMSKAIIGMNYFNNAIAHWNDYSKSLIYMNSNKEFQTLAHYIQRILADASLVKQTLQQAGMNTANIPETTLKYALCVISILPIFILFPFVQKYFSKGIAVGSVKG